MGFLPLKLLLQHQHVKSIFLGFPHASEELLNTGPNLVVVPLEAVDLSLDVLLHSLQILLLFFEVFLGYLTELGDPKESFDPLFLSLLEHPGRVGSVSLDFFLFLLCSMKVLHVLVFLFIQFPLQLSFFLRQPLLVQENVFMRIHFLVLL